MSEAKPESPIVLVDGSSYLFRAYHALPKLENSKGHPTGAIRGVISMIRKLSNDYPHSKILVVFDAKGKTFRNELYPEYKANRPPMPEDLAPQINPIHNIIKALGLPLLMVNGVEADDVIGTLAHEATNKGLHTIISTGDKDMAQLVSDHVTLINTMSDTALDRHGVIEKFGVPPELIVDYLALIGDKVDNIPGVPNCGPKTAGKWLNQIGPLKEIIANAGQVKGKIGDNLRAALGHLPLSYELATIKSDVTLPEPLEAIQPRAPDQNLLLEYYRQYEFKSWISELEQQINPQQPSSEQQAEASDQEQADQPGKEGAEDQQTLVANYQTILTEEEFAHWLQRLQAAKSFIIDTETTSLNYMEAELVGISLALQPGEAAYIPLAHNYLGAPQQLSRDHVLAQLKPLLTDAGIGKIGQNLKYDAHILANYDIELKGINHDTMIESYVLNSVSGRHDMDSMAKRYLNYSTTKFEDIAGKGAKQLTFDQIALDQASPYAAEDADITLRLHEHLSPGLRDSKSLSKLYKDIEIPLIPVLIRMEQHGVCIDCQRLNNHSQQLSERLQALEKQAWELAGEEFNLGSPKQLQAIFYDKLGYEVLKKTAKNQRSTAEPVLIELAQKYQLPKVLLEYRGLSKLKSTYTDRLPTMITPRTGRVHTSYHQAVAATGRLSSTDPNLQNIPVRNEEGRRIRQAFVAERGHRLISADYSQIELRIMAHLSGDSGLLAAFAANADVHRATAAEVFKVSVDEVTGEQRRQAKAINFGLIYGMSAFGLANQIKVDRTTAQNYIDLYFQHYPGVQNYMEAIKSEAHEQGFVETLFGRRLYLPNIASGNRMLRNAAERTAINAPMQGTAADIIKLAMLKVDQWLQTSNQPARLIMQVHDELILEVAEDAVEDVSRQLTELMAGAAELQVPLLVEAGSGSNWDEAH